MALRPLSLPYWYDHGQHREQFWTSESVAQAFCLASTDCIRKVLYSLSCSEEIAGSSTLIATMHKQLKLASDR